MKIKPKEREMEWNKNGKKEEKNEGLGNDTDNSRFCSGESQNC